MHKKPLIVIKNHLRGSWLAPSHSLQGQNKSSRFAVRTISLYTALTQKFAVRSSHLLSLHCPNTKVRGSQFAPSFFLHCPYSKFAVRSSHLSLSLSSFLSSKFAVRGSHLILLLSAQIEKFAVRCSQLTQIQSPLL